MVHAAQLLTILLTCLGIKAINNDLPSFPQSSVGVFAEPLGDFYPRSITVSMIIVLPNSNFVLPEISDDDLYLSFCPKPPNRLVFDTNQDRQHPTCYSETPSGDRRELLSYRCIYCTSYTDTVSRIADEMNSKDSVRPKRQAFGIATALLSAIGWLQTNLRMDGLVSKVGYIVDTVKNFGASLLGVQNNMIAVVNATRANHKGLVTVGESLLSMQREVTQSFNRTQSAIAAVQQQEEDVLEYNVRINNWRNYHMRYLHAKQLHDSYINTAVRAMRGGKPDISIIDTDDLWKKLELVKHNLSSSLSYKYTFGDDVFQAFASATVLHISTDHEGNFCIVLSIRAYNPEKYELLELHAYPFPILAENGTIVTYKKIELVHSRIAIISNKDQPDVYTIPGRPELLSAGRWTDARPDARLVYSVARTCESAIAFADDDNTARCLLQAKAVTNVRPKYSITNKHWMFTGTTNRLTEICGNERTMIRVVPLMIVQPKCGCRYVNEDDRAFYNDKDSCNIDTISLKTSAYSGRTVPTAEMTAALLLLSRPSKIVENIESHNSSWIPDIEKILMGQTTFDGTMAQMIHQQTIQAQLHSNTMAAFERNTSFNGYQSYYLFALVGMLIVIICLIAVVWWQCRKSSAHGRDLKDVFARLKDSET